MHDPSGRGSASSDRPRLAPLNGRPLMVNPVVAIEYWPFDRPMPRGILPAPHGRTSEPPDVANYSWVEYGMRCGLPRLFDVLGRRGIKASAWMNAQCADVYPSAAECAASAGWDFVGHSWFQRSLKEVEDEEAEVRRSLVRLEKLTGKRVRGWFGAGGGETVKRLALHGPHRHVIDFPGIREAITAVPRPCSSKHDDGDHGGLGSVRGSLKSPRRRLPHDLHGRGLRLRDECGTGGRRQALRGS